MATGWVWAGFFHTRTRPVGQDLWPRPGQFIKRIFFPRAQTRPIGLHGPRWPQPKIINPKICTNLESQIAKYNVIFLAIIQFSWQFSCYSNGCQDLTNQSIQKIQQILETKLANLKIPATKYQENPTNLAHKKKKPQTQILLTKIRKKKSQTTSIVDL